MAQFVTNVEFTNLPAKFPLLVSQPVGFAKPLAAVSIDNYTPYWIYLRDSDSYVPPYWTGAVRPLVHTSQYAYAEVKNPFTGDQSPNLIDASYFMHFVWTDVPQGFQGGSSISAVTMGGGGVPPSTTTITGFTSVIISNSCNLFYATPTPIILELPQRKAVIIQAPITNRYPVFVGGADVSGYNATGNTGIMLLPGESLPMMLTEDVQIYATWTDGTQSSHYPSPTPAPILVILEGY
jgi:hypothetical protein